MSTIREKADRLIAEGKVVDRSTNPRPINVWSVEGDSGFYMVVIDGSKVTCNCEAARFGSPCSHALAAKIAAGLEE